MRRAWILKPVPREYFLDTSPLAIPAGDTAEEGRKAFDLDDSTYCTSSGVTTSFGIQARWSRSRVNGVFMEPANWDSAGLKGMHYQYGISGHYSNMTFDELVSNDPENVSFYDSNTGVYIEYDDLYFLVRFQATLFNMNYQQVSLASYFPGDDFVTPGVWVGEVIEFDPMYNLGWSETCERVGYTGATSVTGVDLDRVSRAADIVFKKTWSFSFEWVTGSERDNLLGAYSIDPVKFMQLDEFGVFTHHTVVFASPPKVQEVEDDYYTITFSLKEV